MHALDNPVWESLRSRHSSLGRRHGAAARYLRDVAPFVAVDPGEPDAGGDVAALVDPGESVLLVGPCPALPPDWSVRGPEPIAQMVCREPIRQQPGSDFIDLSDRHRADILALVALVYPHYFRPRTPELGRYIGIYDGDRLAAMAGERMGFDGYQEISAVCTHPDYTGRGHAQTLVTELTNASLAAGRIPFLHVSPANLRAKALYERLGYAHRTDIPLWSVRQV